jgi:DeoR/GlpR family transcriptional regulator of sugar metabolism
VTGPDALDYLGHFHVTHAIIGASRLDASGPSDFNSASVWIKRTMIKQAEQTILVLDHEKLEKTGFERICPLSEIDWLVTDASIGGGLTKAVEKAKVKVQLAAD